MKVISGRSWAGKPEVVPGYPHLRRFQDVIIVGRRNLDRAVERSLATIREWLERTQNPVISFSCGKDSTVIAHLVAQIRPDVPLLRHSTSDPHLPDVYEMMDYWRREMGCRVEEWVFGSLLDWYEQWGLTSPRVDEEYKRRALAYQKERGFDGICRGLRAEESKDRRKLAQTQDPLRLQQGVWMCDPILHWTAEHVWSYIALHGLPYAQVYDLDDGKPRNERRLGSVFGTTGATYGRIVWLRRFYPELYRIFVDRFPAVSKYT